MHIQTITAQKREKTGKDVKSLRHEDLVPGVIYGPEVKENVLVTLPVVALTKLYDEVGETSVIEVAVEGEKDPYECLIKDIAYDPVIGTITHVDFYKFKVGQTIEAAIELHFVGEAPAVKNLSGSFVPALHELSVKAKPRDLISELEVDISSLETFDDVIFVKDLKVPESFEVLDDPEAPVASVLAHHEEEEPAGAPEAEMPEVDGAEKVEGGDAPVADGDAKAEKTE